MTEPIKMLLWCPMCHVRHIDVGEFATKSHHSHACQSCGMVWRPAIEPTCGVEFLPGFKNEPELPPVAIHVLYAGAPLCDAKHLRCPPSSWRTGEYWISLTDIANGAEKVSEATCRKCVETSVATLGGPVPR